MGGGLCAAHRKIPVSSTWSAPMITECHVMDMVENRCHLNWMFMSRSMNCCHIESFNHPMHVNSIPFFQFMWTASHAWSACSLFIFEESRSMNRCHLESFNHPMHVDSIPFFS